MEMPGRKWTYSDYRYGFNDKESDGEVQGGGNSYDFGDRVFDPRIGRFLSIDPYTKLFAYQSPYIFAANNPIVYIDIEGAFRMTASQQQKYPKLTNILKNLESTVKNNPDVWAAFKKTLGLTEEQATEIVRWNSGPHVLVGKLDADDVNGIENWAMTEGKNVTFNKKLIETLEGRRTTSSGINEGQVGLLTFITALHEGQHYAELNYKIPFWKKFGEVGFKFERMAFGNLFTPANIGNFNNPSIQQSINQQVISPEHLDPVQINSIPNNTPEPELKTSPTPSGPSESLPSQKQSTPKAGQKIKVEPKLKG